MRPGNRQIRRLVLPGAVAAALALAGASVAFGALVSGSLPAASFTYTSTSINDVNMAGTGVHLKTKGAITVKTTYSKVAPSEAFVGGWHYHNGPVLVTVTVGTITLFGGDCGTWDVSAGQTYLETTGQVLNAKILPAKNGGTTPAEWFTTRLYPEGAADPVPLAEAPCSP